MKKLLIVLSLLAPFASAQTVPSPQVSKADAPTVIADYLGYAPTVEDVRIYSAGATSSVVVAWNVTNAVPNWSGVFSATNVVAALDRYAAGEQYRVIGVVTSTNEIKAIRQDLRTIKTNAAANKATMQATVALTNGYTATEARQLINDIRRELIDTIAEQQAQTKAALDMLKAQ